MLRRRCRCTQFWPDCAYLTRRIAELEERLRLYEGASCSEIEHDGHLALQGTDRNLAIQGSVRSTDEDMSRALRGINRLKFAPRMPEFYGGSSSEALEAVQAQETHSCQEASESDALVADLSSPENRALLWLGSSSGLTFGKATGALLPPKAVAADYVDRYFQTAHRILYSQQETVCWHFCRLLQRTAYGRQGI